MADTKATSSVTDASTLAYSEMDDSECGSVASLAKYRVDIAAAQFRRNQLLGLACILLSCTLCTCFGTAAIVLLSIYVPKDR